MRISPDNFNKPPMDVFVHPLICKNLLIYGLTDRTHFDWYLHGNVADLVTFYWDADGYYLKPQEEINKVNRPTIIPAYSQIMMMELIAGPFSLIRDECNGGFELAVDAVWNCDPVFDKRLPDVFAGMVLQMIRKRILYADSINEKIKELIK
jgi:hypothetical protein